MKTRLLITGIISAFIILAIILHTELLGEHATYGECIVTASYSHGGFNSSVDRSTSENQCKQSCAWTGSSNQKHDDTNVSCKFQTVSGYGWIESAEEFEDLIVDYPVSRNPLH